MAPETQTRWALLVLAAIAMFGALWVARAVFAPLTLAFTLAVMLSPLSDFWHRHRVPAIVGSLISLAVGLALLSVLILALEPLVVSIYEQAPRIKLELRDAVAGLQSMMQGLNEVSEEVTKAIAPDGSDDVDSINKDQGVAAPSLSDALFLAPAIAGQLLIFAGGLYFFLLCRADLYRWLAKFAQIPDAEAVKTFQEADRLVARYSLTISLINATFGLAVGIALHIVGMPGAILWAFVAALMNFVMYLGPAIVALALAVAGTVAFDGIYSLVPAAVFVGLNVLEGQFITPSLVGHHLRVNPLLVFLSLCVWLWLWGPIGGIVAIPLLVWIIAVTNGIGLTKSDAATTNELFIEGR